MDNKVERLRQLFRLGCPTAVVNTLDIRDETALRQLCAYKHEAVMRELADGADVNIKGGWTPLIWASCCSCAHAGRQSWCAASAHMNTSIRSSSPLSNL